jgi:CRP-like cAMP-binding protein
MTQAAANAIGRHITFMALGDDPEMFDEEFIRLLSELTVEEDLPEGATLQAKGFPADTLRMVTEGDVASESGGVFPPNPILHGLDGAVTSGNYSHTLIARTKVHTLSIATASFFELLEDQLPTSTTLLSTLAARVEAARSFKPLIGPRMDLTSSLVCRSLALRALPTFSRVSAESVVNLARMSTAHELAAGEPLTFSPRALHVLMTGALTGARLGDDQELRYEGLMMLNTAATFANTLDRYTCVATEPSTLISVDKEDVFTEMRYHFSVWRALVASMLNENKLFTG